MLASFLFFYLGSFSYTCCTGLIFMWGVSLKHPVLNSFLCGEFLLHIPCWIYFYVGSFSYTSHACLWGVSLTHPVSASFLCQEFLLKILCWLHFLVGSFSYTSHATFVFIWGVSLTHPMLPSFLCKEFLLHIQCCLDFYARNYTSHAGIIFFIFFCLGSVFFKDLVLVSFFIRVFSYTSRAGFIFNWGFSFTKEGKMIATLINIFQMQYICISIQCTVYPV